MRIYLLLFFCGICLFFPSQAQDELKTPVVVIKSVATDEFGDEFVELGTGIIVGEEEENLFILTAAHVLKNPRNTSVRFWGTYSEIEVKILQSSARWDIAVVQCKRPSSFAMTKSFKLSKLKPTFKEDVVLVGHPGGDHWYINILNAVNGLEYEADDRLFTITPQGIDGGNSGGPILNEQNELLGMVQRTDNRKAVGVSAIAIREVLKTWRIPINLLSNDYKDPLVGDMVYVEGDSFTMGSNEGETDEKPPHLVEVRSFYMGRYEVTQAQWKEIMNGHNPSTYKCDDCPVENVSWDDAKAFIAKLNQRSAYQYRLPTEAEWEYAAGGTNRTKYVGVENEKEIFGYANLCDVNCSFRWKNQIQNDGYATTAPVGSFLPNSLGIHDLSGNVSEWCEDWYQDSYENAPKDSRPWVTPKGLSRVLRGSTWSSTVKEIKTSRRGRSVPENRRDRIGFRLVRTP